MADEAKTVSQVVGERLRQVRGKNGRGWSQQDLAARLTELGSPMHQTAIAKIENGERKVTVEDAFALAAALDVSPLHLLVPVDDEEQVQVTPKWTESALRVRKWMRGRSPLRGQDPVPYTTFVPANEWAAYHNSQYGLVIQYVENLVFVEGGLDQETLVSELEDMVEGIKWSVKPRTEKEI